MFSFLLEKDYKKLIKDLFITKYGSIDTFTSHNSGMLYLRMGNVCQNGYPVFTIKDEEFIFFVDFPPILKAFYEELKKD